MRSVNFRIPPEDYLKLEEIAQDVGVSISEVGREAIARYLNRAGAGQRVRSRLDRLEDQVNRLTLMLVQPQGGRADQASQYLRNLRRIN